MLGSKIDKDNYNQRDHKNMSVVRVLYLIITSLVINEQL